MLYFINLTDFSHFFCSNISNNSINMDDESIKTQKTQLNKTVINTLLTILEKELRKNKAKEKTLFLLQLAFCIKMSSDLYHI